MCDTKLHRLHEFPILPVRLHRYGVGGRRGWRRHVVWAAGCSASVWAFTRISPKRTRLPLGAWFRRSPLRLGGDNRYG
jgi:hypothetical protein